MNIPQAEDANDQVSARKSMSMDSKRQRPMVILDWRNDPAIKEEQEAKAEELGWRRKLPLVGGALQLPRKGTEREWLNGMIEKGYR